MTQARRPMAPVSLGPVEGITLFSTPICSVFPPLASERRDALGDIIMGQCRDAIENNGAYWISPWGFPKLGSGSGCIIGAAARAMVAQIAPSIAGIEALPDDWRVSWRAEVIAADGGCAPVREPEANFAGLFMVGKDVSSAAAGGLLEFQDPRGPAPVMYAPFVTFVGPGSKSLGVTQTLNLEPGLLVVFPAYLMQSFSFYRGARPHITLRLAIRRGLTG